MNEFTINDLATATNRGIALDGRALDANTRCNTSFSPSDPGSTCENVPSTPVLDWDPVPSAAGYEVLLAEDPDLTTLVLVDRTQNSRWNPRRAIADNESRPAYYWYIRPSRSRRSRAAPLTHARSRTSPPTRSASFRPRSS